jgi:hypothetical protein
LFSKNIFAEFNSSKLQWAQGGGNLVPGRESVRNFGPGVLRPEKFMQIANIEEINFEFLDKITIIKDLSVVFQPTEAQYEVGCCYFLINSSTKTNKMEKTVQIGLDNPELARKLNHKAFECRLKRNQYDDLVMHLDINHTKVNVNRDSVINSLEVLTF